MRLKSRLIWFGVVIVVLALVAGVVIGMKIKDGAREAGNGGLNNNGGVAVKDEQGNRGSSNYVGEFKVARVIDGDTIEIAGGERVRYIGIDTPETVDPRKPVQCFGVEASNKNKDLVGGETVRLEKDITDRDKYNRLLRYVWVGETFVNLELVKQGFAFSYSYPPDIKYQDQFLKAQEEAEENKRGLWDACPAENTEGGPVSGNSEGCLIKGNISTSGEKIYHLPGCGSYDKTSINESGGERWFCTEAEARAAGWRKALNCP